MKSQLPIYLLICGVGIIIGILITQPDASDDVIPNKDSGQNAKVPTLSPNPGTALITDRLDALQVQLDNIQERLARESEQRQALAGEVDQLKDSLLHANNTDDNTGESRVFRTQARTGASQQGKWFNEQALISAGVDASQAERIRAVYEDVEMQKLYLRDKAIREGWIGGDRYREERAKLDNQLASLKDELGETAYDAYLYAAGRPNRVIVTSALNNSPASKAGIQAGDTILRYDNKRIYSWSDLRTATSTGDINAIVLIEVLRNGQPVNVYVPRGPLGVQLDNRSMAPVN